MAVFVSLWVYVERGMKQNDVVLYVIEKVMFLKPFFCFVFACASCTRITSSSGCDDCRMRLMSSLFREHEVHLRAFLADE